jgi:hypothetical protein
MMARGQGVTLTLTVHEDKFLRPVSPSTTVGSSFSEGRRSPAMLPMTVSDSSEPKRFRMPWRSSSYGDMRNGGAKSPATPEIESKRLEKEREAEAYIESQSGRSLSIQRSFVEKALNKERRKVKFGLSSSKIMDLAIRRYAYKYVPSSCERELIVA